jgi:hypothetical protein
MNLEVLTFNMVVGTLSCPIPKYHFCWFQCRRFEIVKVFFLWSQIKAYCYFFTSSFFFLNLCHFFYLWNFSMPSSIFYYFNSSRIPKLIMILVFVFNLKVHHVYSIIHFLKWFEVSFKKSATSFSWFCKLSFWNWNCTRQSTNI